MTWHVTGLKDVAPAPWRNGGGTTRELVAWPGSAAWQWRASVAEIAQDGPFSSFAGIKRWFAVLEGDGVCLTVDGYLHMLTKSDAPLAFDGISQTDCELLGGTTQDFNLMLQADVPSRMLRITDSYQMIANTPKIIAVHAHKERATVQIDSEIHVLSPHFFGWVHVEAGTVVQVLASNALLMEIDI